MCRRVVGRQRDAALESGGWEAGPKRLRTNKFISRDGNSIGEKP